MFILNVYATSSVKNGDIDFAYLIEFNRANLISAMRETTMKIPVIISYIILLFSSRVYANSQNEINHLLNYVKTTTCQYERNGSMHSGIEAVAHIQKKYRYFKEDIKTAEDFILYSATKSTFSGDYYKVHCPSLMTINSQDWLIEELNRYRANQK